MSFCSKRCAFHFYLGVEASCARASPSSTVMLDLITPAENHIMRISQNRSDISGLVWCVAARRARPQIADAVRIASTFDIIGIDRTRFTPTADMHRATSDEGTPNPCASISTAAVQRHEHFVSCVSAADQKQSLRAAGPAFERNKCRQCVVKSIRSAFWYRPATAVPERIQ